MSGAAYLRAFGSYVPQRRVDNHELATRTGRDAADIERTTGILVRRYAAENESVVDLALAAATDCLQQAGAAASELGLILLSSGSSERAFPGPAAILAARLGLTATPAIDLPFASAGSLIAMALATDLAARYGLVLVVAAEIMSRRINDADPDTAILFGDGAGACLIGRDKGLARIVDVALRTDGNYAEALSLQHGGTIKMEGLQVILQASRKIPNAIKDLLAANNIAPADIEIFMLHQANRNLLTRIAKTLSVPEDCVFSNIANYGNTSSASMLIAAREWNGWATLTGPVVFAAFGAGFQWGALLAVPSTT